jgi:hypothetical protein
MNSAEECLVGERSENAVPNVSREINFALGPVTVLETESVAGTFRRKASRFSGDSEPHALPGQGITRYYQTAAKLLAASLYKAIVTPGWRPI